MKHYEETNCPKCGQKALYDRADEDRPYKPHMEKTCVIILKEIKELIENKLEEIDEN